MDTPDSAPDARPADLKVGCAGWAIPSRHADLFGPGASVLARYATRFPIVEINSSFYRPHRPGTYRRWAESVPDDFRFSVKVPRSISHELRLCDAGPALDGFFGQVCALEEKLGRLLLQLPPSLQFDARTASVFFRMMRRRTAVPIVCEPRHPTWFDPRVTAMLERHGIARAAVDPAPVPAAALPAADRRHSYWRWHGSPRIYYSEYDHAALQALADAIRQERGDGDTPWVIFDNTALGHAVPNAAQMQAIVGNRAEGESQM
ncbi:hypothetical protein PIGHUM_02516 [Pigmentiphaga humi]|uniref:DUF72 domain-containing protein n=1 Tax=Pigmentiphaga humi TaxID=2478468 RepID=A0A3P4B2D1_9BURK|nr:DUF72 domain-containing protein [Pigmentiphaga humi]VCU70444.1 hypothetical protein PIGHUM_02516 [Pigmentiphaga humi]